MITNKDNKELKLITLEELCKFCMANKHDAHKIDNAPYRGSHYISSCTNKTDVNDGFTECETCRIWTNLQDIFVTNIK
jgi:hypothetical protein